MSLTWSCGSQGATDLKVISLRSKHDLVECIVMNAMLNCVLVKKTITYTCIVFSFIHRNCLNIVCNARHRTVMTIIRNFLTLRALIFTMRRISVSAHIALLTVA